MTSFSRNAVGAKLPASTRTQVPSLLNAIRQSLQQQAKQDVETQRLVTSSSSKGADALFDELGTGDAAHPQQPLTTSSSTSVSQVGTAQSPLGSSDSTERPRKQSMPLGKPKSPKSLAKSLRESINKMRHDSELKTQILTTSNQYLIARHDVAVPKAIQALSLKVIRPSVLKAASVMRAESLTVGAIRVLPAKDWRVTSTFPHHQIEEECGIFGRANPLPRLRFVRSEVDDLLMNEMDWKGRTATFTAYTNPSGLDLDPSRIGSPKRWLRFLMHRRNMTLQDAFTLLSSTANISPRSFEVQSTLEATAATTTICALDTATLGTHSKTEVLNIIRRVFSVNASTHRQSVGLQVLGFTDVPLVCAGGSVQNTLLCRSIPSHGPTLKHRPTKSLHTGFINFFGPRKFGLGTYKAFHIADYLYADRENERREIDAMLMLMQCCLESDPNLQEAYRQYAKANDDPNVFKPFERKYPWITHLHQLVHSRTHERKPYRDLYFSDAVPQSLRNFHAAAPAAVLWNVAASARMHRMFVKGPPKQKLDAEDEEREEEGVADTIGAIQRGDLLLRRGKALMNHTFVETKWEQEPPVAVSPTAVEEVAALVEDAFGYDTTTGTAPQTEESRGVMEVDDRFLQSAEAASYGIQDLLIPFGDPRSIEGHLAKYDPTVEGGSSGIATSFADLLSGVPHSIDQFIAMKALPIALPPQSLFGYRPFLVVPTRPHVIVLPERGSTDASSKLQLSADDKLLQSGEQSVKKFASKSDKRQVPPLDRSRQGHTLKSRLPPNLWDIKNRNTTTHTATRALAMQFVTPQTSYLSSLLREFALIISDPSKQRYVEARSGGSKHQPLQRSGQQGEVRSSRASGDDDSLQNVVDREERYQGSRYREDRIGSGASARKERSDVAVEGDEENDELAAGNEEEELAEYEELDLSLRKGILRAKAQLREEQRGEATDRRWGSQDQQDDREGAELSEREPSKPTPPLPGPDDDSGNILRFPWMDTGKPVKDAMKSGLTHRFRPQVARWKQVQEHYVTDPDLELGAKAPAASNPKEFSTSPYRE